MSRTRRASIHTGSVLTFPVAIATNASTNPWVADDTLAVRHIISLTPANPTDARRISVRLSGRPLAQNHATHERIAAWT